MKSLGNLQVARVKKRTAKGQAPKGGKFRAYSRRPIYIAADGSETRGVIPKGGKVAQKKKGKTRFYKGGYAHFKRATTGTRNVNYSLSGRMLASTRVTRVTRVFARISVRGRKDAQIAAQLQARDPWLLFGKGDAQALATEARKHQKRLREAAKKASKGKKSILMRELGGGGGFSKFGGGVSLGSGRITGALGATGFGRFRGVHGVR